MNYDQFNTLVLLALGAPVTRNNLNKLAAINQKEGTQAKFNPMAWVIPEPGSTGFNRVGVQNYPDLTTGVVATARGLSQSNTSALRENLKRDGAFTDFISATQKFYTWAPGITFPDANSAQSFGAKQLPWQPTTDDFNNITNQVSADKGGAAEWIPFITGLEGETSKGDFGPLGGGPFGDLPTKASGTGLLGGITNPLDFAKAVWDALSNKDTWVRVAMFIAGLGLVFMGLYLLANHMGAAPSPATVAKVAA